MRTPKGYHVRRGDYEDTTDDRTGRWYIDKDGEPIDHRGKGYATRREAVETLVRRLSDSADTLWWTSGRKDTTS